MADAVPPPCADARVAGVEGNLLTFMRELAELDLFDHEPDPDVTTWSCDVPFALFNGIIGARFAPTEARERAHRLLASFLGRGGPLLWWTTPSTTSPELEGTLLDAGLQCSATPGMHVRLDAAVPVPAGEARIAVTTPDDLTITVDTMCEGFGDPDYARSTMHEAFRRLAQKERLVNVLAWCDDQPVAAGSLWVDGETAGLYNIVTHETFRGRGIGAAVTAMLMEQGRARGCTEAILHATEMALPVYERLGFETVCSVQQFLWDPDGPDTP